MQQATRHRRLFQNSLWGVCKREVRIIEHVSRERVPILNTEYWLLNTAFAEPTQEVLQAPPRPHVRMRATGETSSAPVPSRLNRSGFSLVEVLIAVTLLLVIVIMISMVFQQASGAWASGSTQAKSESAIRAALGSVERDLLNAVDARDYAKSNPSGLSESQTLTFVAFQHLYNHQNPRFSGRHPCLITYTFADGLLDRNMWPIKPDGTLGSNTLSFINSGMPLTDLTFTSIPRPSDPGGLGLPLRVDIRAESPRASKLYTISGRSFGKNKTNDSGDGDDILVGGKL
jgi:prepilin-type N-terminal cleavage/methylation domain-containing protein